MKEKQLEFLFEIIEVMKDLKHKAEKYEVLDKMCEKLLNENNEMQKEIKNLRRERHRYKSLYNTLLSISDYEICEVCEGEGGIHFETEFGGGFDKCDYCDGVGFIKK